MTRLIVVVDLPDHDKYKYTLEINVTNTPNRFALDDFFIFNAQEVLHIGNSKVYKGTLTDESEEICPMPVVCKILVGDSESRLKDEAQIYAKNRELQGPLLPLFFFHCSGTTESNAPVACLVTKYVGESLRTNWGNTPMEIKYKAWVSLRQLHRSGVYHGDFFPRNVVVSAEDGRVRIIDLDHADGEHKCRAAPRAYKLYEPEPSQIELCCDELYDSAFEMDLWTPRWYNFMGLEVHIFEVPSVDALLRYVEKHQPFTPDIYSEWMRRRARAFLKDYHDRYIVRLMEVNTFWRTKFLGITEPEGESTGESEAQSSGESEAKLSGEPEAKLSGEPEAKLSGESEATSPLASLASARPTELS